MAKRVLAWAALAAAAWLAPARAGAEEPGSSRAPEGEPAATATAPAAAPASAPAAAPADPGLLDASHAAVEEGLGGLVDFLDGLFGDRRYLEFGPQRSTVRWRSEVRLTDEPRAYPYTTAFVDLRLPAAAAWFSRAHLVLSGDQQGEGAPGEKGLVAELTASEGRAELRFDLLRRPGTLFYLGGGLPFAWPLDPFARLRLRQDLPLAAWLLGRFTPSLFWQERQGVGATAQLDLDFAVWRSAVVRASGGVLRSESSRGLEWGTSLELRGQLGERLAAALGGSARGAERSPVSVDEYRAFGRLRRDVLRRWLFAEIEPEVVWPTDASGARRTVLGVIVRLEVIFASEIRPSPPPAATSPPPAPPSPAPPAAPGAEAAPEAPRP